MRSPSQPACPALSTHRQRCACPRRHVPQYRPGRRPHPQYPSRRPPAPSRRPRSRHRRRPGQHRGRPQSRHRPCAASCPGSGHRSHNCRCSAPDTEFRSRSCSDSASPPHSSWSACGWSSSDSPQGQQSSVPCQCGIRRSTVSWRAAGGDPRDARRITHSTAPSRSPAIISTKPSCRARRTT